MGIERIRSHPGELDDEGRELIQPLINLIHERMLEEPVLAHGRTRPAGTEGRTGGQPKPRAYMWVMRSTGHPAVLYPLRADAGRAIPKQSCWRTSAER